ncbi:MAG: hypothetical protein LUC92_09110 [Clostridiales bacterium]|nr:hypothetical protein [Clostridiales bacterium]
MVLDNVVISTSGCPLKLSNSATTTLVLSGTNTLKSSGQNPGIYKNTTGYLVIAAYGNDSSAGSLSSTGGYYCAGIGGSGSTASSNITINSGTITTKGGSNGSGIGGGNKADGSYITINGGTVTTTGGYVGAGIGGAYTGNGNRITITGGIVTATGGSYAAGIGGGYSGSGSYITISGGTVTATGDTNAKGMCNGPYGNSGSNIKIYNSSVKASSISVTPTNADGESIYLYTLTDTTEGSSLTVDGETYIENIAYHTSSDTNQYIYLPSDSAYALSEDTLYLLSYSSGSTSVQKIVDFYKTVDALESLEDCAALDEVYDSMLSYYVDDDGYICASFSVGEYLLCTKQLEAAANITDLEIPNLASLCFFEEIVNSGNTTINGTVTADIDLSGIDWTPIGTSANPYFGTFDGGGYTISNMTLTTSSDYGGLFGCVGNSSQGGTVKNFTVSGDITLNGDCSYIGGAVGYGAKTALENIISEVNISNTDGTQSNVGGVVGNSNLSGSYVSKCIYNGTISLSGGSAVGGIVGAVAGSAYINYCYNLGTVEISNSAAYSVGGILGYVNTGYFKGLTYCYNYGNISGDSSEYCGALVGQIGSNTSSSAVSNDYWLDTSASAAFGSNSSGNTEPASNTADEFVNGEIAYLLNNSSSENVSWYQNINNGKTADTYPVLDDSHGTVYHIDIYYYCPNVHETVDMYSNNNGNTETHTYDGETCIYCGQSLSKDESGIYLISDPAELSAFANLVNAGDYDINGIVTADIDFTDYTDTMIGSTNYPYAGTFDGGGYTITLNYNSSEANAALISYASGATIKNLNTAGTITTSAKFAGGILGQTASSTSASTTISGCSSSVNIVSTIDGDGTHGGIAGALNASYDVVENCYFNGSIIGASTTNCAGIVGWLTEETISVENCYVSAEYLLSSSDSGSYNIARGRTSGVSNCYYLNAICSSASDSTQKTADEFAGGEVAYLLNNSVSGGTVWYQNIDSGTADSFPVLDSSHGLVYTTTTTYCPNFVLVTYNNTEDKIVTDENGSETEHSYEKGACKYCGIADIGSIETDESGNYIISTAYQLAAFALTVNSGSTSINGIVAADIDFSEYSYMIGSSSYPYSGTFDGSGHTITVSYEATGTSNMGLFSYVTGGTVENLVVEGSIDFTNAPQGDDTDGGYAHVGGAIGILTGSGGTASNIVSRVNITTPEDNAYPLHQAAGVVGSLQSYASVDKCIYEGTITVYKSYDCIGGIVGYSNDYCSITNCANLGTVYASGKGNTTTTPYVGGILGYINNENFNGLQYCYNYGSISANDTTYCGAVVGWLRSTKSGAITNNYWLDSSAEKAFGTNASSGNTAPVSKTESEFAGGEVAYLLNGGDESGVWVQTIGTDSYPLFTASDTDCCKVAEITSNGSAVYANVVSNGISLSLDGSELLGIIIDTAVYGGEGAEYLNGVGVVIGGTLYQLENYYYADESGNYSESETDNAFFPVSRASDSSSDSITARGEATTSTTKTADDSLLYFVTEATTGLTIAEAAESSDDSGSEADAE